MNAEEAELFYKNYIEWLRKGHTNDLENFVNEALLYNGEQLSRKAFEEKFRTNQYASPDIRVNVQIVMTAHNQIASRLQFDCTPQGRFMDLDTQGRSISFSENVFYRLSGGKISEVWSVVDKAAIEGQL